MYIPLKNCFRKDLIVTNITNKENLTKRYLIKDPISGEIFEFGEEEYFLCKSMDGTSTVSQILTAFKSSFGLSMMEEDFNQFSTQIAELGLLGAYQKQEPSSFADPPSSPKNSLLQTELTKNTLEERELPTKPKHQPQSKKKSKLIWSFYKPDALFIFLGHILKPFQPFSKIFICLLIPSLIFALFTVFNNLSLFRRDLIFFGTLPWLVRHLLTLVFINLTSKLLQGTVCTYYGGTVKEFGLQLRMGFIPRFYTSKNSIWRLKREEQLWALGTPLIITLFVFCLGTLTWSWTRGTENGLKGWALSLGFMGLLHFLIDCSPFWPSDGYGWLIAYFRLSPKVFKQNLLVWEMMLNRRPLPKSLSVKERLKLQVLTLVMVAAWASIAFKIAQHVGYGLIESISPGILSEGARVLALSVPFMLSLRWLLTALGKRRTSMPYESETASYSRLRPSPNQVGVSDSSVTSIPIPGKKLISFGKKTKSWAKNLVKILLIVGFGILLFWPYPYRPGGSVQLLPPTQQQIQAQVDGKITKVFFNGGDGQWIKAGIVIANMEAVDIENSVLITQEQVRQQQAEVEKQQANLNKLLATPKKEDVEVAKQQVEVAKQQVEVANQQVEVAKGELQTAIGKAEFSARQAARFNELYKTGAFSLQQYENAQKEAQTDRNTVEEKKLNVEEAKQNVKTKQQNLQTAQANLALVMSGPYPQDIEAARKEVEAAQATVKRLQQQLKYNQEQIKRTPLEMPIDGYLVTSDLDQKMGRYLKQGEVFAVAEDNRNIRGEVRIPEYNVGEFAVNGKVEIKLLAYPDKPLTGKVISIEPTASTSATGSPTSSERSENSSEKFIRVIIDIPNTEKILKAGMSGYAKIEGRTMPLILAFMRPVIRFLQIEVWSWIP